MMTVLFDEAEARGISKGEAIGEARGLIRGAITTYEEVGISPSEIINKIIARFSLKPDEAKQYVEMTLASKPDCR